MIKRLVLLALVLWHVNPGAVCFGAAGPLPADESTAQDIEPPGVELQADQVSGDDESEQGTVVEEPAFFSQPPGDAVSAIVRVKHQKRPDDVNPNELVVGETGRFTITLNISGAPLEVKEQGVVLVEFPPGIEPTGGYAYDGSSWSYALSPENPHHVTFLHPPGVLAAYTTATFSVDVNVETTAAPTLDVYGSLFIDGEFYGVADRDQVPVIQYGQVRNHGIFTIAWSPGQSTMYLDGKIYHAGTDGTENDSFKIIIDKNGEFRLSEEPDDWHFPALIHSRFNRGPNGTTAEVVSDEALLFNRPQLWQGRISVSDLPSPLNGGGSFAAITQFDCLWGAWIRAADASGELTPARFMPYGILPLRSDGTGGDWASLRGTMPPETAQNRSIYAFDGMTLLLDFPRFPVPYESPKQKATFAATFSVSPAVHVVHRLAPRVFLVDNRSEAAEAAETLDQPSLTAE